MDVGKVAGFVRSLPFLSNAKDLVTFDESLKKQNQHIDNIKFLHFMAFMPNESFAPFFDVHINIKKNLVNKYYLSRHDSAETGFIDWLMITYWRKYKNNEADTPRAIEILNERILPMFPNKTSEIKNAPIDFFEDFLNKSGSYKEIIEFLRN